MLLNQPRYTQSVQAKYNAEVLRIHKDSLIAEINKEPERWERIEQLLEESVENLNQRIREKQELGAALEPRKGSPTTGKPQKMYPIRNNCLDKREELSEILSVYHEPLRAVQIV